MRWPTRSGATPSLRRRILLLTTGLVTLVLVLLAIPLGILMGQAAQEQAVSAATERARAAADYLSSTGVGDAAAVRAYVNRVSGRGDDGDDTALTVVLPSGEIVGAALPDGSRVPRTAQRSSEAPENDDRDDTRDPVGAAETQVVEGGRLVRVDVVTGDGLASVAAFAPSGQVSEVVRGRLLMLGVATVVLVAGAALAAERLARRLVRDLDAAAATADQLAAGDLTARAPADGHAEVVRVAAALNRLAGRIDELLVAERESMADLSHRLRTPLTAVRLDVESLDPSERTADLVAHLDQVERTLTAVIHQARRPEREGARPSSQARAVVTERFEFWTPLLEDQARECHLEVPPGADSFAVRCADDDLRAAVDALIENVVAHTPEGTPLRVTLRSVQEPADGDLVVIDVADQGPGVPPDAVHRGRSDRGSTGLGLDIARSCAVASGGRLELDREGPWSIVRLVLGRA